MPPRVAIIGCGRIATSAHLPAWQVMAAAGRCTLAGVTDLDPARAAQASMAFAVPAYPSVEALLAEVRPDIVDITTLLDRHHDLTQQALAAGCHVLCEKPIARDATEARAMVAAAERAGRLLSICFQSRTRPEAAHLRSLLAGGELGAVLSIRTWGNEVRSLPVNRPWPAGGGGVLNHATIHNLDLALWLLDYPAVLSVTAAGWQRLNRLGVATVPMAGGLQRVDAVPPEIEDVGHAWLRLAGGAVLTVEANFLARPAERPSGYELLTERGTASLLPLRVWRDTGDAWVDLTPPAGTLPPAPTGMTGLMSAFLTAVGSGGPAPVAGREIVALQQIVDSVYVSLRQGREICLTLT
ncbi:MAG: Gfo/Idh/MocA family oxidoreductase [Chloroflexi bacterium]|nr:Gfo/Idh/MocA family oxidoreductase [Chloroflexota bacterium]